MELKEIIQIIIRRKTIFFAVLLTVIFLSIGWLLFQPSRYQASLAIDIARNEIAGTIEHQEYQYDQYYRLLADEKFADTIVQWAGDPQIAREIFEKAGIGIRARSLGSFSRLINGKKLSSNFVQIKFSASSKENAEKIAKAIEDIFSEKTKKINSVPNGDNWFRLNFDKAIIVEYNPSFLIILFFSVIGGILLAFFAVMVSHYWKEEAD